MPVVDAAPVPLADRLDAVLAARRHAVTLLLVAAAVTVRALFWMQVSQGPCAALHRWEQSDMHHFDAWAAAIAAGDLASRTVEVPLNLPHRAIARDHLAAHPDDPAAATPDPARTLWARWLGDGRFYQEPLYPYLAAVAYRALPGDGPRAVAWLQMLAGVLTVLWVRRIARRRFGPTAGLLAGAGMVAAGPVLFFEALLLRETLIVLAGVMLVDAADRALDRGGAAQWAALGLLVGLAAALKGHFVLFGLGMAATAAWRLRATPRRALAAVGAMAAGWLAAAAPVAVRNLAMGVPAFATASGGGYTFLLANLPGADPAQGGAPGVAPHVAATGGRLLPAALAAIGAWDPPVAWLGLVARKAAVLLHWPEVPNNENWALFREYAPVLAALPVSFAAVLPPAIAGVLAAPRRALRDVPLALMVATHLAALLLFMPLGRFRAPLVPLLLPVAAFGTLWVADALAGRRWRPALAALLAVAAVAAVAWRPAGPDANRVRPADRAATLQAWTLPLGETALSLGRWEAATAVYRDALDHAPDPIGRIARGESATLDAWEVPLAGLYAAVWDGLATARQALGDAEDAGAARRAAERLERRAGGAPPPVPAPDL